MLIDLQTCLCWIWVGSVRTHSALISASSRTPYRICLSRDSSSISVRTAWSLLKDALHRRCPPLWWCLADVRERKEQTTCPCSWRAQVRAGTFECTRDGLYWLHRRDKGHWRRRAASRKDLRQHSVPPQNTSLCEHRRRSSCRWRFGASSCLSAAQTLPSDSRHRPFVDTACISSLGIRLCPANDPFLGSLPLPLRRAAC